jgi:hypothetical protein
VLLDEEASRPRLMVAAGLRVRVVELDQHQLDEGQGGEVVELGPRDQSTER